MEVEQAKWELYNQCSVALQCTRRLPPCCEDLLTQGGKRRILSVYEALPWGDKQYEKKEELTTHL